VDPREITLVEFIASVLVKVRSLVERYYQEPARTAVPHDELFG